MGLRMGIFPWSVRSTVKLVYWGNTHKTNLRPPVPVCMEQREILGVL